MSWQGLISVTSSSVGLVAGVWLCIGSATISPKQIAKANDNSWKSQPYLGEVLINQSAEYLAGGCLLVLSFVLQVIASSNEWASIQEIDLILNNTYIVVLLSILFSLLISYPIYSFRKKWLVKRQYCGS